MTDSAHRAIAAGSHLTSVVPPGGDSRHRVLARAPRSHRQRRLRLRVRLDIQRSSGRRSQPAPRQWCLGCDHRAAAPTRVKRTRAPLGSCALRVEGGSGAKLNAVVGKRGVWIATSAVAPTTTPGVTLVSRDNDRESEVARDVALRRTRVVRTQSSRSQRGGHRRGVQSLREHAQGELRPAQVPPNDNASCSKPAYDTNGSHQTWGQQIASSGYGRSSRVPSASVAGLPNPGNGSPYFTRV